MERKLIHYLPYAIREFAEFQGITTGEQPEFELAWDAHEEVFVNQFVDTALDYGLSRWEKMLNLFPKATDTLESRRARIKAKLNNFTPYTIRAFAQMMDAISNGEFFDLSIEPGSYLLSIFTRWTTRGQMDGLDYLIRHIVPCNIAIINTWESRPLEPPLHAAPSLGPALSNTTLPKLGPALKSSKARLAPVLGGSFSITKLPNVQREEETA